MHLLKFKKLQSNLSRAVVDVSVKNNSKDNNLMPITTVENSPEMIQAKNDMKNVHQDYVATRWYRAPELCGSFFSKVPLLQLGYIVDSNKPLYFASPAAINGLHSISVRDLRTKIISQNKLQICKDFDLDISDADTGKVLDDENFQLKAGSSIVIKRVPAGSKVPYDLNAKLVCAPKEGVDEDLDDFGMDLYANIHGSSLPNSCNDVGKSGFIVNEEEDVVPRFFYGIFSKMSV